MTWEKFTIDLKFIAINASGLSALFQKVDGGPHFNLPMGSIEFDSSEHNTIVEVSLPEWLAISRGLV